MAGTGPMIMGVDGSLGVLINNFMETQRNMANKIDDALSKMATRDDIAHLSNTLTLQLAQTVPRPEAEKVWKLYDDQITAMRLVQTDHEARIRKFESERIPPKVWAALTTVLGIIGVVVGHIWK